MTDPIQAAIEKAEEACPCRIRHGANHDTMKMCGEIACWCYSLKIDREKMAFGWPGEQDERPCCRWPGHAAIRSLAALVREYGHVRQCSCCDLKHPQHNFGQHHNVHVDPRCLEAK